MNWDWSREEPARLCLLDRDGTVTEVARIDPAHFSDFDCVLIQNEMLYLDRPTGDVMAVHVETGEVRTVSQAPVSYTHLDVYKRQARRVRKNGEDVSLTPREYDLLEVFLRNRGVTLYRDALFERIWGEMPEEGSRTLDLHVQRLRKKLGWHSEIRTLYKIGYLLEEGAP